MNPTSNPKRKDVFPKSAPEIKWPGSSLKAGWHPVATCADRAVSNMQTSRKIIALEPNRRSRHVLDMLITCMPVIAGLPIKKTSHWVFWRPVARSFWTAVPAVWWTAHDSISQPTSWPGPWKMRRATSSPWRQPMPRYGSPRSRWLHLRLPTANTQYATEKIAHSRDQRSASSSSVLHFKAATHVKNEIVNIISR